MFYVVCCLIACATAALIVLPMLRPPEVQSDDPQVALYKAQLAEVDRDVARGVLAATEADRAKAEIARRLIAASKQNKTIAQGPLRRPVVFATACAVVLLSAGVYALLGAPGYPDMPREARIARGDEARAIRPSQSAAEALAPVFPEPKISEDYAALIANLREVVPTRADEPEGWALLSRHEAELRNYAAAAFAQGNLVNVLGENASEEDLRRHVDLLVLSLIHI